MKTEHKKIQDVFSSTSNYQAASEAMSSILDVINVDNRDIDTGYLDCLIYEENKKRRVDSSASLKLRRSIHIISNHLKSLVISSAKEQIARHGSFKMPASGDNDYIFDDVIIEKYGVYDDGDLKGEWDKYGYFSVAYASSMAQLMYKHSCSNMDIQVYFYGELGLDFIELTKTSDVDDSFMKIEIDVSNISSADDVVRLADELLATQSNRS